MLALFGGLAVGYVSGWVYALALASGLSMLTPVRRTVLQILALQRSYLHVHLTQPPWQHVHGWPI